MEWRRWDRPFRRSISPSRASFGCLRSHVRPRAKPVEPYARRRTERRRRRPEAAASVFRILTAICRLEDCGCNDGASVAIKTKPGHSRSRERVGNWSSQKHVLCIDIPYRWSCTCVRASSFSVLPSRSRLVFTLIVSQSRRTPRWLFRRRTARQRRPPRFAPQGRRVAEHAPPRQTASESLAGALSARWRRLLRQ